MSLERLADRAVHVAERLLRHGRESVVVEITRQGHAKGTKDRLGIGLQVAADPYTLVEGLELLADKLDRDAAAEAVSSFTGRIDA